MKKEVNFMLLFMSIKLTIFGSESHLDHTYFSSEIFPDNFLAIRKDRIIVGGGGVFIAFKKHLALIEQPSLSGEAEMIWAKFQVDNKVTYLCSFYRPPNTNTGPLLHLRESITQIHQSANIILGEDFNYPDILWDDGIGRIDTNLAYGNEVNTLFLELLNDFGMEQLVGEPTRNNNLLDLILCTEPSTVINVTTVPGISDHEGVFFQLKTCVEKCTVTPRKIYQFHKANSSVIKWEVLEFSQVFLVRIPTKDLWKRIGLFLRRPFIVLLKEIFQLK